MAPEAAGNKEAVQSEWERERQRFFQFVKFSLKQREDGLIVPDYNIQEYTLHMKLRLGRGRRMLRVKTMADTTLVLEVQPSDTILDVKLKIQETEGIPVAEERLMFMARQLQNNEAVADCGIQEEGSTVTLVVWCYLRGGYIRGPTYLAYVDYLRMSRIT